MSGWTVPVVLPAGEGIGASTGATANQAVGAHSGDGVYQGQGASNPGTQTGRVNAHKVVDDGGDETATAVSKSE